MVIPAQAGITHQRLAKVSDFLLVGLSAEIKDRDSI